eukprot:GHRQ01027651.1.p1 GENE.GHRQ01027651.1~~GHRQ01027651.1.p1  ORF type:complete len:125 (+),score=19.69 GHRQ01027651.1:2-376(+)
MPAGITLGVQQVTGLHYASDFLVLSYRIAIRTTAILIQSQSQETAASAPVHAFQRISTTACGQTQQATHTIKGGGCIAAKQPPHALRPEVVLLTVLQAAMTCFLLTYWGAVMHAMLNFASNLMH